MIRTRKTHDLRAGQAKQGDSSKGTRQRTPQICKGHRTHGKGRERSGPAAGQRAPREVLRGGRGELLAVLHMIGQRADKFDFSSRSREIAKKKRKRGENGARSMHTEPAALHRCGSGARDAA